MGAQQELIREKIVFILSTDFCKQIINSDPLDISKVCEGMCVPCRTSAILALIEEELPSFRRER